ncbi:phosphoenolpyruvate carboxykinase (ATP) [Methanobacterium paludis]|uniref:hypothetical protein n=1 Tax=Methanobacterium paludis (strain DSM 25820 / JCM 18151 / SWAN1) TaxID=868131 RepID=UPI00117C1C19|nr:hypothetical protein [Methanobacterium paludis]
MNVKSSIYFPELTSGKQDFDVTIHFKNEKSFYPIKSSEKQGFSKIIDTAKNIIYLLDNKPLFKVKNGQEIIVNPKSTINTDINLNFLRSLILGAGMGILLMQRGNLVLHASALNMGGGAVAFLGWCGSGKSTIVTAMNNRGYPFVTDDVLTVKIDKIDIPLAFPSFPRVKLWDDTIKHMPDDPTLFQKIHPEVQKYFYNLENSFYPNSLPLKMIYIIEDGKKNEIIPLKMQDALINVAKNSYCINTFDFDSKMKSQNFFQCANLVKNVPVKRLIRYKSLEKLEYLTQIIEEDVFNVLK